MQRKWRENQMKKILNSEFNLSNCNKMDILKQSKDRLYNILMKDEKFKNIINLSYELFSAWSLYGKTECNILLTAVYSQLKNNLFSLHYTDNENANFNMILSKIITADISLKRLLEKNIIKKFKSETLETYRQYNTAIKAKSIHI
jgi:hypothetical protein